MNLIKSLSKIYIVLIAFGLLLSCSCSNQSELMKTNSNNINTKYVLLSTSLLNSVKASKQSQVNEIRSTLKTVHEDSLASSLSTDAQKKAFWINIYNAHIQILLSEDPTLFNDRGKFFGAPRVTIAGNKLSFDDIEHGIIRSSKIKLSLGLLRNPFASSFEKKFRTKETDGRVHFALNCGAKSCPLVAVYEANNFDEKIDQVAKKFLHKVSTYKPDEVKVITTPLFSWFRGDFNGKNGVLKFLKKYDVVPEDKKPSISYDNYDWTLSLGNYYESN